MRTERDKPRRRYWLALLFVIAGAGLGAWHNRAQARGNSDPVVGVVRGVVTPPASILNRVSRWTGDQTGWLFRGRTLQEENTRLRRRVEELEGQVASLAEAQVTADRLRSDLGFVKGKATSLLAADVLIRGADPKFQTIVISRGSADGVKPGSIVLTKAGLVGQITDVTPGTASVLLLTDVKAGVGARVQKRGDRSVGVCKGDFSPTLTLAYLPNNADVRPGDIIVTSGLGGVFPSGIRIGVVVTAGPDAGNTNKIARVQPFVDFDRLEQVYVRP